jgi:hypothetical protein
MNTLLPLVPGPATRPPLVSAGQEPAGSLSDYFYQQAEKALNEVDPIPLTPHISPGTLGGVQGNNMESAGSPYLAEWAMDTRPSYKLSDAELSDKGRWQLEALRKREVLKRAMEVPIVFPPGDKS